MSRFFYNCLIETTITCGIQVCTFHDGCKQSISKFIIGNRFDVKLRILSPENCKQSLQVKSWKAEAFERLNL